jgi:general secretion pathway protein A
MYEKFFHFSELPFNLTPDPRFFFFSKKHEEAFEHILFGIKQRRGFIVISGEVGIGKTTLCRLLLDRLDKIDSRLKTALIFNPSLTTIELLQAINRDYGIKHQSSSKGELVSELNSFLLRELSLGGNALLIIDEAQNLSTECMEEIRMLSNLETEKEKLIQILLVGQPELQAKLGLQELRQLNQRITLRYHIQPLDLEETRAYIGYRLKVAGGQDRVLFTPKALERIYQASSGIPRLINAICDKALLAAFVDEARVVNENCVSKALPELAVTPARQRRRSFGEALNRRKPLFSKAGVLTIGVLLVLGLGLGWVQDRMGREAFGPRAGSSMGDATHPFPSPPQEVSLPVAEPSDPTFVGPVPLADGQARNEITPDAATVGFDADGVYRVQDPTVTKSAALLTLMKLWGVEPPEQPDRLSADLSPFLEDQDLQIYTFNPDLKRLRTFDYPCLISGRWDSGTEISYLVLTGLTDTEATVLDPLQGRRGLSLDRLQDLWGDEAILLWKTLPGVILPVEERGSKSDSRASVRAVQEALKTQGLYRGKVDGKMGPKTRRAVRLFQQKWGLEEDGIFGIESHLVLSKTVSSQTSAVGALSLKTGTL